jgi:hypothetical protein
MSGRRSTRLRGGPRPHPGTSARRRRTSVDPGPRRVASATLTRNQSPRRPNPLRYGGDRCRGRSRCSGRFRELRRFCELRRRTTGPPLGEPLPALAADRSGAFLRQRSGAFLRRQMDACFPASLRSRTDARHDAILRSLEDATFAGAAGRRGQRSALGRGRPSRHRDPRPHGPFRRGAHPRGRLRDRQVRDRRRRDHLLAHLRHGDPLRRDPHAVPVQRVQRVRRGPRPSGPGRRLRTRWSRSAVASWGSSPFQRWYELSSGYRGHRRYGRRRLPLVPWAFRVPQPRQPTFQPLPPQYPDKRRGPLDLIGSDPLQACPAASYSPTRSPAQYHRR